MLTFVTPNAQCDSVRLENLFVANKRRALDDLNPDYDGSIFKTLSRKQVPSAIKLTSTEACNMEVMQSARGGIVAKQQRDDRKYREYANKAQKAETDVNSY